MGATLLDRFGWSARVKIPGDDYFLESAIRGPGHIDASALLGRFRQRSKQHFFGGFESPEATMRALQTKWPEAEQDVLRAAESICSKHFLLFGRYLSFGDPIDWLADPVTGKRTDLDHWSTIDFLSPEVAGDYKFTWELNRHQYLITLGKAYWYTRDERFAEEFVAQLESWMASNPPGRGINWASSLELAFRTVAWIWSLSFFADSRKITPGFFLQVVQFLHLHGLHIETYLSTYFSPNTHLTGEALGLIYLGLMFPDLASASRWQSTGHAIFAEQIPRHVLPDGVYFERSTYYHRYTADFLIHLWALGRRNEVPLPPTLSSGLERLLEHLMLIAKPDGTTPLIGDDDGGRVLMLDDRPPNDFRATLATGAVLFERSDLRHTAGEPAEETLWLLGPRGVRAFENLDSQPPTDESRAFFPGGYLVMRDGWDPTANYCILDCGPHGTMNCGHAHADALAFELAAGGTTLFVDPGTYTYACPVQDRDYFRSTEAHNTLTVGGAGASVPAGPFGWGHIATASPETWISDPSFDYFAGTHDGFERLEDSVTHRREVLFLKGNYWVLRDTLSCKAAHEVALRFHLDPSLTASHLPDSLELLSDEGGRPRASVGTFGPGRFLVQPGRVSRGYGRQVEGLVGIFQATLEPGQSLLSLVIPGMEIDEVGCTELEQGRLFQVVYHSHEDTLGFGASSDILLALGIETDFQIVWVRRSKSTGRLHQFVGIQGSRLLVDKHVAFEAADTVDHVAERIVSEAGTVTDADDPSP